jgi:hypothetical protein
MVSGSVFLLPMRIESGSNPVPDPKHCLPGTRTTERHGNDKWQHILVENLALFHLHFLLFSQILSHFLCLWKTILDFWKKLI